MTYRFHYTWLNWCLYIASLSNLRFDDFPKLKRVIVTNYKNGGGIQSWDGLLEAGNKIYYKFIGCPEPEMDKNMILDI